MHEMAVFWPVCGKHTFQLLVCPYFGSLFMQVVITDTAGLRETADLIEAEGIEITQQTAQAADIVVIVTEAQRQAADASTAAVRAQHEARQSQAVLASAAAPQAAAISSTPGSTAETSEGAGMEGMAWAAHENGSERAPEPSGAGAGHQEAVQHPVLSRPGASSPGHLEPQTADNQLLQDPGPAGSPGLQGLQQWLAAAAGKPTIWLRNKADWLEGDAAASQGAPKEAVLMCSCLTGSGLQAFEASLQQAVRQLVEQGKGECGAVMSRSVA